MNRTAFPGWAPGEQSEFERTCNAIAIGECVVPSPGTTGYAIGSTYKQARSWAQYMDAKLSRRRK